MHPNATPRALAPRSLVLATALALTLLFGGCASVVVPLSEVPAAAQRHAAAGAPVTAAPLATPASAWWQALHDPQLDALVAWAEAGNHELQAALAAVQAARALTQAAQRDALPQGRLDAQASSQRPSLIEVDPYSQGLPRPPVQNVATLGQGLAWEIDLFGRVGTASAVAERRADGARADLHAATALLQAEVVQHYTQLRLQQQRLQALELLAQTLQQREGLLQARVQAGLADRREALAASGERVQLQAERAQAAAAEQVHRAALAVLAGRTPQAAGQPAATAQDQRWQALLAAPALRGAANAGASLLPAVPSDTPWLQAGELLARRPDVARADAELRASLGEAVLAGRAHLPRLSLNLAVALNAPFGALGQSSALRHAAGPQLSWDWLDAGRTQAREAAARAGGQAAWHRFEQTVLRALQDSEQALQQWTAAQLAWQQAQQAQALAEQARAHAQARSDAGLETPVAALAQAAQAQQAQLQAVQAQAQALLAWGQLQLALGAWQPEAALASPAAAVAGAPR